ncbi:class I SAM-dependent methyltransferase [Candidatus Entotheonella palauensis]|uniref:Methyltransferase n=1 Tax=Candidatus Entotheonella gemina TaxID=1429439 RepID=W4M7M1_9BACT|nr:MAG: methyltransferase [Candidatus Entotheonella gemina]
MHTPPYDSLTFPETADIETSSEDYARRFSGAVGAWFLRVQEQATLRMLPPASGTTILDVGGGHGQLTEAFLRQGYVVTVLGSAEVCQQRIRHLLDDQRCTFRVGNLIKLPYPDRAFDVVVSYRLLPHVTQWQALVAELTRVARQVVLVDYPTLYSVNVMTPLLFRFKKRLEGNTRPYTLFKERDLLAVFQRHGFQRTQRYAEFFLPMALHRMLKAPKLSSAAEQLCRLCGLSLVFGSPVVLRLEREGE